jgi:hypothetical protein
MTSLRLASAGGCFSAVVVEDLTLQADATALSWGSSLADGVSESVGVGSRSMVPVGGSALRAGASAAGLGGSDGVSVGIVNSQLN